MVGIDGVLVEMQESVGCLYDSYFWLIFYILYVVLVVVFVFIFIYFLYSHLVLKNYLFGIYSYLHYIDKTDRMNTMVYSRNLYHATVCPTSYNTIDLHPIPRKACTYVCM